MLRTNAGLPKFRRLKKRGNLESKIKFGGRGRKEGKGKIIFEADLGGRVRFGGMDIVIKENKDGITFTKQMNSLLSKIATLFFFTFLTHAISNVLNISVHLEVLILTLVIGSCVLFYLFTKEKLQSLFVDRKTQLIEADDLHITFSNIEKFVLEVTMKPDVGTDISVVAILKIGGLVQLIKVDSENEGKKVIKLLAQIVGVPCELYTDYGLAGNSTESII